MKSRKCLVVSFLGARHSQRVTEWHKGELGLWRKQTYKCNGKSSLNWETGRSIRIERWS